MVCHSGLKPVISVSLPFPTSVSSAFGLPLSGSLDVIQSENMEAAQQSLESWTPVADEVNHLSPSPLLVLICVFCHVTLIMCFLPVV